MNWLGQIISGVVSPITSIFEARQKRKQAAEQAEAKIKLAKQQGDQELSLKDQEWEALAIKATEGTWKDELITLVFMGVFVIFIFGGLAAAFGFPGTLNGLAIGINALTAAGVDLGFLMEAVILAGLGLSIWRKF
jgi:hypothetical protein